MKELLRQQDRIALFVHHPCIDGAMCVPQMERFLGKKLEAVHGADHGIEGQFPAMDRLAPGVSVLFADYCPPVEDLQKLLDRPDIPQVFVIDHHYSTEKALAAFSHPKLHTLMDSSRCGATLVYGMINGRDREPPAVLKIVEEMDLQKHGRGEAFFEEAAYVDSYGLGTMDEALRSARRLENTPLEKIRSRGKKMLRIQRRRIARCLVGMKDLSLALFDRNMKVPLVEAPLRELGRYFNDSLLEIAGSPDNGSGLCLCAFEDGALWRVSVRSAGGINAADVASHLGWKYGERPGGGHESAAAFQVSREQYGAFLAQCAAGPAGSLRWRIPPTACASR